MPLAGCCQFLSVNRVTAYNSSCLYGSDEMSLSEVTGHSMCGLDVIWEGHCHNSMDQLVEET